MLVCVHGAADLLVPKSAMCSNRQTSSSVSQICTVRYLQCWLEWLRQCRLGSAAYVYFKRGCIMTKKYEFDGLNCFV